MQRVVVTSGAKVVSLFHTERSECVNYDSEGCFSGEK